MADATPEPELSTTRARRIVIYHLIAGQHLVNYLCRLSIPYIVPFICAQSGYSDTQRAMLLNSFTPGYVMTQIPGAAMIDLIGAKATLTVNNLGMLVALVLLPVAARSGATAVAACFALLGVVQGPYVTATTWMTKHWVPTGPERPLGIMVCRNGSNLSKVLAAAITPQLCGRFGWQAVPWFYGAVIAVFVGAWTTLSSSQPPPLPSAAPSAESGPKAAAASPRKPARPFTMRLLVTQPALALFGSQLSHNLGEFHVFGPWLPTYFNEVLGVPMQSVGSYTSWGVLTAILMKLVVGVTESRLLSRGYPQLFLRKAAVTTSSILVICGIVLFDRTRIPWVAALAQVIIFSGSSFDSQAGFLPNTLEVAGDDVGYFGGIMNTGEPAAPSPVAVSAPLTLRGCGQRYGCPASSSRRAWPG